MKKCFVVLLALMLAGVYSCAWAELRIEGDFPSGQVGVPYISPLVSLEGYASYWAGYGWSGRVYLWDVIKGELPPGLGIKLAGRPRSSAEYNYEYLDIRYS